MSVNRNVNPWLVLLVLSLGTFMTLLDLTIVNIAIPSIVDGVHASLDQVLWMLNGYSLAYAVLLITSGRLGDIVGPRNVFIAGLALFTAASAYTGLAQDANHLIAGRVLQGIGAALLAPQGMAILLRVMTPELRGASFAVFGILAGLAVVAGPTVGGWLTTGFGWRWIFYVNIPFGIATIAAALAFIPNLRPGQRHRLDLPGVALVTAGLAAVVFGQRYDWGTVNGWLTIPEIIGGGLAVLAIFLVYQALRQRAEPLLTFALFRNRNFTLMVVVLSAMGFQIVGFYLPLTIYYQSVLGLSAIAAGLTIAIQPVSMMFSSGLANSPLGQRLPTKYVVASGLTLLAAGSTYVAWAAHVGAARWDFLPGLIVSGLGMGCIWGPVYQLATRGLDPELGGVASGVMNTIQELGAVIASASVGALLQNRLAIALHSRAVDASAQLPAQFRDGFVSGFSNSAKSGLEVGAGQTGGQLPAGLPAQVATQLQALGHSVFANAFVDAMRPTLVLPIVVILLAALLALAARGGSTASQPIAEDAAA